MNKRATILKWIFFSLSILVNAFIIYQSALSRSSSNAWSDVVINIIYDITGGSVEAETPVTPDVTFWDVVRKAVGHFSLFLVSGVFTYLYFYYLNKEGIFPLKYLHLLIPIFIGIVLAALTEIIQSFVPGRNGNIADVFIDSGGYVLGVGIVYLITYLVNRKVNKEEKQVE